ncbi:DUF6686 family protein [Brumimicrobium aurantiacum]|uniref:Uncharacterized protein n=1 Tax=Brumimicrobium aurantiacum TaxID=1737063 RepID=A0A3E1F095_9FLAO|nr:DUF6686 family protein [Brumimicrobium aurantiacum]RFC55236.1 hypothetical protein DXU93_05290 [Brumimicrobium aurantiacum]
MPQQILSHDKNGFIAICNNCGNYQIFFGTTGIYLKYNELMEIIEFARDEYKYFQNYEYIDQKCIQIPTFNDNTQLVLTYRELQKLQVLLEEASIMIQVHNILNER